MMFTMKEPYYGIILSSMNRVPAPQKVPTMAVGRTGNVFQLIYNPKFVESLSIDGAMEVIKHEMLHLCLNHFTLFETEPETEQEQTLRNYALDMEVNGYIDTSKITCATPVTAEKFGWEKFLGGREYYRLLTERNSQLLQKQTGNASNPQKPCNGGTGGKDDQDGPTGQPTVRPPQGTGTQPVNRDSQQTPSSDAGAQVCQNTQAQNPQGANVHSGDTQQQGGSPSGIAQELQKQLQSFDDHSTWPRTSTDEDMQQLQEAIDTMMVFAADEVEKAHGTVPGEIAGKITELRKRRPKPVADWKRYFRRYIGHEFSEFLRKSKKRESRRFPDAPGNRLRRKSHILVAIDTSGSVSMTEYREFFGQIRTLMATATFHVVECDVEIQHEYEFNGRIQEVLHGGGGTDFEPVIDYFNKHKKLYDALIYFTDGGADIPADTPKETLWVISSQGIQEAKRYRINGASVAFIKPKQ